MAIILASGSPRRQELLAQIGCKFRIEQSDVIEDNTLAMAPAQLAVLQAEAKARAVAAKAGADDVVIGADTIVVLGQAVFGKPTDAAAAKVMLRQLSGRDHQVITGVAVVHAGRSYTDFTATTVTMRQLTDAEIENYVATGEPLDKAGAYGIQGLGALLIERIAGCYTNVVGLPVVTLARLLNKVGITLL